MHHEDLVLKMRDYAGAATEDDDHKVSAFRAGQKKASNYQNTAKYTMTQTQKGLSRFGKTKRIS